MTQKLHREFVVNTAVKMTYNDIKYKERGEKAAVVHWRTYLQVSLGTYTDVTLLFSLYSRRKLLKIIYVEVKSFFRKRTLRENKPSIWKYLRKYFILAN